MSDVSLLSIVPQDVAGHCQCYEQLVEIIMDIGRSLVFRYTDHFDVIARKINRGDLDYVVEHIGEFGDDDRAGMDGQLHRISCIRNRRGDIIGLTLRVGRHIPRAADLICDLLSSEKSIILLGKPGLGKTTILRAAAYILSTDLRKNVVIIDTSNEICGDGDVPHESVGLSRRMSVRHVVEQAVVMQRAVENHTPEVIIIDEIGNTEEALAARTIAERGVQLIATAHGNTLEELLRNPALNDLLGGIQSVILGDKTAAQRGTQKTVLERKAPTTFQILVEMLDRDTLVVHRDLQEAVDAYLRQESLTREIRKMEGGQLVAVCDEAVRVDSIRDRASSHPRLAVYGIKYDHVKQAVGRLGKNISLARRAEEATHLVVRSRYLDQDDPNVKRFLDDGIIPIPVRTNNYDHILAALVKAFRLSG